MVFDLLRETPALIGRAGCSWGEPTVLIVSLFCELIS